MTCSCSTQNGFTLFEVLVAGSLSAVIAGIGFYFVSMQQAAAAAELYRVNARAVAQDLLRLAKTQFVSTGQDAIVGPGTIVFNATSRFETICVDAPKGAAVAPSYATLSAAECPAACLAGKLPQVKATYFDSGGTSRVRYFPTNLSATPGALLCVREVDAPEIFPKSARRSGWELFVHVGWKTNKVGTDAQSLWSVAGLFLYGVD